MKFALAVMAIAFLAVGPAQSMIYNRCSLAQKLNSMGVPYNELAIWTCIAEHESSYNTAAVGPPNSDGSNDWGLFQINDMYWCAPPSGRYSANGCHVQCQTLTSDDITPDVACANQVKNEQGFEAWATWHYCNGNLPSIDSCF